MPGLDCQIAFNPVLGLLEISGRWSSPQNQLGQSGTAHPIIFSTNRKPIQGPMAINNRRSAKENHADSVDA